jgi:hypothetical protein
MNPFGNFFISFCSDQSENQLFFIYIGDDDDDIDTVGLIEKNLEISYLIVDKLHIERPVTLNDQFWKDFEEQTPT